MEVAIEVVLRSVVTALELIHVQGKDAEMLGGAIKALKNVIEAIDKAKKGAQTDDHHNEPGKDV